MYKWIHAVQICVVQWSTVYLFYQQKSSNNPGNDNLVADIRTLRHEFFATELLALSEDVIK